MSNNSDDIRRLMNLMESVQTPTLLEGWVDGLKNKIHGRMGDKQRKQMADELKKEYYTWLGQTNRQGTIDDMVRFMTHRIGFKDDDIDTVLANAGFEEDEIESAEQDDQANEPTNQKIKPGSVAQNVSDDSDSYDPEDGVPLPQDLENTKLSDFAKYGMDVEKSDNKVEPEEVVDDPRKYKTANGEWDRKKIRARLDKMPFGAKLTLGTSTFHRTTDDTSDFEDQGEEADAANESIMEDTDLDILDKNTVAQIMDASAAQVNDEYLLNGPERDKDAAMSSMRTGRNRNRPSGFQAGQNQASPNVPNKEGSGRYDAKEMVNILKTDFQINNANSFVDTLTRKVMKAPSISSLSDNDMNDLALLGWALIRARN